MTYEECFKNVLVTVKMLGHGYGTGEPDLEVLRYEFWSKGNGKDTLMGMVYVKSSGESSIYYNDYNDRIHKRKLFKSSDQMYETAIEWVGWL